MACLLVGARDQDDVGAFAHWEPSQKGRSLAVVSAPVDARPAHNVPASRPSRFQLRSKVTIGVAIDGAF